MPHAIQTAELEPLLTGDNWEGWEVSLRNPKTGNPLIIERDTNAGHTITIALTRHERCTVKICARGFELASGEVSTEEDAWTAADMLARAMGIGWAN